MADEWLDLPLSQPLFDQGNEDAVVGYTTALENAFHNKLGGVTRFPGLRRFAQIGASAHRIYLSDFNDDLMATDDKGQVWWVFDGDPAWHLVHKLWSRGVREIVLPRRTFITGQVVDMVVPQNLASFNVSNEALAMLLRRYVRLRDCLAFLVEAQDGSNRRATDVPQVETAAVGGT